MPRKTTTFRAFQPLRPMPRTVPKAAVKVCAKGHKQVQRWKPADGCARCDYDEAQRLRALHAVAERQAWSQRLGPVPAVLEIRVVDTGRVLRFAAPGKRRAKGRRR